MIWERKSSQRYLGDLAATLCRESVLGTSGEKVDGSAKK
jgi:hypothetical protein